MLMRTELHFHCSSALCWVFFDMESDVVFGAWFPSCANVRLLHDPFSPVYLVVSPLYAVHLKNIAHLTSSTVRAQLLRHLSNLYTPDPLHLYNMPRIGKTTTRHHCPKKGKGQGNYRLGKDHCLEHQMKCPIGHPVAYLKTEPCPRCSGDTAVSPTITPSNRTRLADRSLL